MFLKNQKVTKVPLVQVGRQKCFANIRRSQKCPMKFALTCGMVGPPKAFEKLQICTKKLICFLLTQVDVQAWKRDILL